MMAPEAHKPDRWALHLILSSPPPTYFPPPPSSSSSSSPHFPPSPSFFSPFFFFFNQPAFQSICVSHHQETPKKIHFFVICFVFQERKKEDMGGTTLELMDGNGGGTVGSGNSMSTGSESYSSNPEEDSDLELGLALSLGGGGGGVGGLKKSKIDVWGQCPAGRSMILTAEDFPTGGFSKSSSSSSSGSSATKAGNASCGSKRAAESSCSPPPAALSQVVGWPPIRTYRINSLVSQAKPEAVEEDFSEKCPNKVHPVGLNNSVANKNSFFVKVNMDGVMIGRKVDLAAHSNYDSLARTLDDMFFVKITDLIPEEKKATTREAPGLLDGSSEFVLTYEDKEGDWMLVGDVPWKIFVCSVKRLRIARKSEANGLGPSLCHERNGGEA